MSETIAVKVSKELKERMRRLRNRVDWPNEIRRFIEERIRQEEAEENLKQVIELLKRTKGGVEKGFAVAAVRESREGHR